VPFEIGPVCERRTSSLNVTARHTVMALAVPNTSCRPQLLTLVVLAVAPQATSSSPPLAHP